MNSAASSGRYTVFLIVAVQQRRRGIKGNSPQGMVPRGESRELGGKRSVPDRRSSFCKGPEAKGTLAHLRDYQFGSEEDVDLW